MQDKSYNFNAMLEGAFPKVVCEHAACITDVELADFDDPDDDRRLVWEMFREHAWNDVPLKRIRRWPESVFWLNTSGAGMLLPAYMKAALSEGPNGRTMGTLLFSLFGSESSCLNPPKAWLSSAQQNALRFFVYLCLKSDKNFLVVGEDIRASILRYYLVSEPGV